MMMGVERVLKVNFAPSGGEALGSSKKSEVVSPSLPVALCFPPLGGERAKQMSACGGKRNRGSGLRESIRSSRLRHKSLTFAADLPGAGVFCSFRKSHASSFRAPGCFYRRPQLFVHGYRREATDKTYVTVKR